MQNEAPRSVLRGIRAELRRSLTRLRSIELRRGSPYLSSQQQAQGIQAKANKIKYLNYIQFIKSIIFKVT